MEAPNCWVIFDIKTARKSHGSTFKTYSDSNHFCYYHHGASYCYFLPGVLQYSTCYFIFLLQSLSPWSLFQNCSPSDLIDSKSQIMLLWFNTLWWFPLSLKINVLVYMMLPHQQHPPLPLQSRWPPCCSSDMPACSYRRTFAQLFPLPALLFS